MREIYLKVLGEPVGKGRPRFSTRGGFVKTYTPAKTTEYEKKIRDEFLNNYQPSMFEDEALELNAKFVFEMPKSWSKKKRELLNGKPCTKRPDLDNCIKSVMDALNKGIAYTDDAQITDTSRSIKRWGTEPYTEIIIREVGYEHI